MRTRFDPDGPFRKVVSEPVVLAGGGRALVLQVAHPLVAAGVANHSNFQQDPFRRLAGTLAVVDAVVSGNGADEALSHTRAVHRLVHGTSSSGATYSAMDPDLVAHVGGTLIDTAEMFWSLQFGPMPEHWREDFWREAAQFISLFGCPLRRLPGSYDTWRMWWDTHLASLEPDDVSRQLVTQILDPLTFGPVGFPFLEAVRAVTIASLPAQLAEDVGLSVHRRHRHAYQLFCVTARTSRFVPSGVRRHTSVALSAGVRAAQTLTS